MEPFRGLFYTKQKLRGRTRKEAKCREQMCNFAEVHHVCVASFRAFDVEKGYARSDALGRLFMDIIEAPMLCYWNGCIKFSRNGVYYEGSNRMYIVYHQLQSASEALPDGSALSSYWIRCFQKRLLD
ncbi:hypothetical protein DY000_02012444 [Brassica cretica]|uniref:Uncharacterized protein n=1 Tax=Brassica cretica TaxID=69181 RepID=A0ABQ7CTP7_BRACR|nr:hypothetical protein DY000_02012444 [Brassica cretica]